MSAGLRAGPGPRARRGPRRDRAARPRSRQPRSPHAPAPPPRTATRGQALDAGLLPASPDSTPRPRHSDPSPGPANPGPRAAGGALSAPPGTSLNPPGDCRAASPLLACSYFREAGPGGVFEGGASLLTGERRSLRRGEAGRRWRGRRRGLLRCGAGAGPGVPVGWGGARGGACAAAGRGGACLRLAGRAASPPEVVRPGSELLAPWTPATCSPAAGKGTWAACGEDPRSREGAGGLPRPAGVQRLSAPTRGAPGRIRSPRAPWRRAPCHPVAPDADPGAGWDPFVAPFSYLTLRTGPRSPGRQRLSVQLAPAPGARRGGQGRPVGTRAPLFLGPPSPGTSDTPSPS